MGVPVAAAVAALIALRRVQVSPLVVTRRVTPKPPRIWRLIPLIAARRLADHPKAGFRAISGLVVGLFVTSVTVGIITTMADYRTGPTATPQVGNTVVDDFQNPSSGNPQAVPMPAATLARLQSAAGVQGAELGR